MILSEETMEILDNFSSINPSIKLSKGSVIHTMSLQKSIHAIATIDETIPKDVCIYDTKRFLATLKLFNEPDVEFDKNFFIISHKKSKVTYTYCSEDMITVPKQSSIKLPSVDVTFDLEWETFKEVMRASGILQLKEIFVWSDDGKIFIGVNSSSDSTSDTFRHEIGDYDGNDDFKVIILAENLKLLPNDYRVNICLDGFIEMNSKKVKYFIACEAE